MLTLGVASCSDATDSAACRHPFRVCGTLVPSVEPGRQCLLEEHILHWVRHALLSLRCCSFSTWQDAKSSSSFPPPQQTAVRSLLWKSSGASPSRPKWKHFTSAHSRTPQGQRHPLLQRCWPQGPRSGPETPQCLACSITLLGLEYFRKNCLKAVLVNGPVLPPLADTLCLQREREPDGLPLKAAHRIRVCPGCRAAQDALTSGKVGEGNKVLSSSSGTRAPPACRAVPLRHMTVMLPLSLNEHKEADQTLSQPYENCRRRATDRDCTGKT